MDTPPRAQERRKLIVQESSVLGIRWIGGGCLLEWRGGCGGGAGRSGGLADLWMLWEVMALVGVAGGLAIGAFSIRHCQILNKRFRERGKSLKFLDPYSKHSLPEESIFNEPTKFLSIVFPCYNEENRLPSTLTETLNYLSKRKSEQGLKFSYEIIVVDDGSKDSTVNQALEFSKKVGIGNVRVLKLGKNRGKGAAVREGMLHCRGALCLLADADAATEITDLEKLEAQLR